MLKQNYRLPARQKIVGSTFQTPYCLIKSSPNNLTYSRFGFVISKKTSSLATIRNRTKRLIRHIVEDHLEMIKPGFDVLFVLSKPIEKLSPEIEEVILEALRKQHVL